MATRLANLYDAIRDWNYDTDAEMKKFNVEKIGPAIHDLTSLYLGTTALHKAVESGKVKLLDQLITAARGIVGTKDDNNQTAYHLALQLKNVELIKQFVTRKNNEIIPTRPDKVIGAINRRLTTGEWYLNSSPMSVLAAALRTDYFNDDILATLLSHESLNLGDDLPLEDDYYTFGIGELNKKPIVLAVRNVLFETFKVCVAKGQNINLLLKINNGSGFYYEPLLSYAISSESHNGNLIAEYLMDQPGIDLNLTHDSIGYKKPLHYGIDADNVSIVKKILLKLPNELTAKDSVGNTLLHRAVRRGSLEVVRYLVDQAPALKNTFNDMGLTPLEVAHDNSILEQMRTTRKGIMPQIVQLLMASEVLGSFSVDIAWFGFDGSEALDFKGNGNLSIAAILTANIVQQGGNKFSILPEELSTKTAARNLAVVASRVIGSKTVQVALFFNTMNDNGKYTWEWGSLQNLVSDPNDHRNDTYKSSVFIPCVKVDEAWLGSTGELKDRVAAILQANIARLGGSKFLIARNDMNMYASGTTLHATVSRRIGDRIVRAVLNMAPPAGTATAFNYTYQWTWGSRDFVSMDPNDSISDDYKQLYPLPPIVVNAAWYGESGSSSEFLCSDGGRVSEVIANKIKIEGGEGFSIGGFEITSQNRGTKLAVQLTRVVNANPVTVSLFFTAADAGGKYRWSWGNAENVMDVSGNSAYKTLYPSQNQHVSILSRITIEAAWYGLEGSQRDWLDSSNTREIKYLIDENLVANGGEKFSLTGPTLNSIPRGNKLAIVLSRTVDTLYVQAALFFDGPNDNDKYTWTWGSTNNLVTGPNDRRNDNYKVRYQ